jgi:hypothetical protein
MPSLQEMADRMAIIDVLTQHCRGVDRADLDILQSCYWPDASVDYGAFVGAAHEFCERLAKSMLRFKLTRHLITNIAIAIDGAKARCETYVTAFHLRENDENREMTFLGRYLDVLERRGQHWKMLHRLVVMDWNQNVSPTAIWDDVRFSRMRSRGAHDGSDPLYAFLTEGFGSGSDGAV